MKITSVEPQKKNPKRFNIFLDGQFGFGADEDVVVKYRLIVGKVINTEELQKILFDSEVGKLLGHLYNLFSFRQRSEKEVRDYFRRKNQVLRVKDKEQIADIVIESAIQLLKEKGMINDLEFAKAWVESRRTAKQKGPQVLKSELYQKGIDREIIEQVFNEQLAMNNEQSDEELATQALEKKMNTWRSLEKQEVKQKASQFLLRRGFDYTVVKTVVAKLLLKR